MRLKPGAYLILGMLDRGIQTGYAINHAGAGRGTASRSVLGFMNDMAATSRYLAARAGGISHLDAGDLNAFLRPTPFHRDRLTPGHPRRS